LSAKQLLARLVPNGQLREKPPEGAVVSVVKRVLGGGDEKIKVRGFGDLMVFRARCCNPIRGEQIVGYITRGKGVSVHSASCPNVENLVIQASERRRGGWIGGDGVDLYARISRKAGDLNGRAGRIGLPEERSVHLVDLLEIVQIDQINRRADDVGERQPGGGEDRSE